MSNHLCQLTTCHLIWRSLPLDAVSQIPDKTLVTRVVEYDRFTQLSGRGDDLLARLREVTPR